MKRTVTEKFLHVTCYIITFERKTMRKLALRDEILLQIDKAARYIGGEVNAVMKNKEDVDIRFAMAFPDVYRTHLISSTGNNI